MAAHRYWRLRFLNPVGYALVSIGEIEFRTSHGGTQAATGGTALSGGNYSGSYLPAEAFNGIYSSSSAADGWVCPSGSSSGWVGYDWGVGVTVDIVEFALWPRFGVPLEYPENIVLDFSDDGVNWTTSWGVARASYIATTLQVYSSPVTAHSIGYIPCREGFEDGNADNWYFTLSAGNWSVAASQSGYNAEGNYALWHVAGGSEVAIAVADLTTNHIESVLDAGTENLDVSVSIIDYVSDADSGRFRLIFFDENGYGISATAFTAGSSISSWTTVNMSVPIPVGTRMVMIELRCDLSTGLICNIGFDSISIGPEPFPPEPGVGGRVVVFICT